ncbi:protein rexA [Xenorhabdus bovienii]|uniref:protein rexA n=1 Tax=Xenorhabdus bovienii TaxID=40576 RepID=UPI0023B3455C|nr:protein rexA [Xenorhabdus bovienii]MDE9455245.1 protein rexA [Xenorhabdus bovienii]
MKLNFHAVYTENEEFNKFSMALESKINHSVISPKKHALECNGYYLYMHKISNHAYLFTKTNDGELIKKINKSTASVEDIKNSLASDESLGFPSFLYINKDVIGYASSIYGPSIRELKIYLCKKLNFNSNHNLVIEPLIRNISSKETERMVFIGRTTLKTEADTNTFQKILAAFGASDVREELYEGIEVIIKPRKNKDIRKLASKIINNPDNKFSDIHIRAREELGDHLTDFYLSGQGIISTNLKKATNQEIAMEMENCHERTKHAIIKAMNESIPDGLM